MNNFFNLIFFKKEPSSFLKKEAKRYLEEDCEATDDYDFQGRLFTRGVQAQKTNDGKVKLVRQAKLCDIGLLS